VGCHRTAGPRDLPERLDEPVVGNAGKTHRIHFNGGDLEACRATVGHAGNLVQRAGGRKRHVKPDVDDGFTADVRHLGLEPLQ
jgi:hypothetical protein